MKNIFTFIVFCLFSSSLMGQISTSYSEQSPKISVESQPIYRVQLDSLILATYDNKSKIKSQTKCIYTYNSYNKLASSVVQEWRDGEFNYENVATYIYDSEGNISKQAYIQDKHGTINGEVEEECIVDSRGNIIESNTRAAMFVAIMESEHRFKTENTYNEQGKKTEYTSYEWDSEESEWKGSLRMKSIYDADGKKKQNLHYQCNQSDCTWEKDGKTDYIYDSKGRKSEIIDYNWGEREIIDERRSGHNFSTRSVIPTGEWEYIPQRKTEIIYDAQGRSTQEIDYKWYADSVQWLPNFKEESHFDDLHDGSSILRPYKPSNNKLKEVVIHKWNNYDSIWQLSSKKTYYYSNIIKEDKFSPSDIIVSPNPAENFITFNIENTDESFYVKLYDMQGKLLITRQLYTHNKLSVSHLSSGTYFYQLHQNNQFHTGKIVIK